MNDLLETTVNELFFFSSVNISLSDNRKITIPVSSMEKDNGTWKLTYQQQKLFIEITAKQYDSVSVFWISEKSSGFSARDAVTILFGRTQMETIAASYHDVMWWMYPKFINDFSGIPEKSQSVWCKKGNSHIYMLPLCGDEFRSEFGQERLTLSSGKTGMTNLDGAFLAVSIASDVYDAVRNCFRVSGNCHAIRVPLREGSIRKC